MKINKRALESVKIISMDGEKLVRLFRKLAVEFAIKVLDEEADEAGNIEFTIGFDEDGTAPKGDLLPEIILRLKVKE